MITEIAEPLYPTATQHPLSDHSLPGTIDAKNQIVLHITQGSTASGAIRTFETSVQPRRTSAHFVVDQDGTVYQLLALSDIGWHASQANHHSVGIEHAAIADAALYIPGSPIPPAKLPVTEAQYKASAALCAWICVQLKITCDRAHIRTHNEASPADHHVLCCTGALDPDKLVAMAQALLAAPPAAVQPAPAPAPPPGMIVA